MDSEVIITQSIMYLVSDGIMMMTDTGTITAINPAAVRMFGFSSADEIVGHNVKLLIPDLFPSSQDPVAEAKVSGVGRKATGRKRDNTYFSIMVTITETTVANRKQYAGVMREIVERKRVAPFILEKMVELQTILDHLPEQAWIKDIQSRYLMANKPFASSLGKLVEEIQGLSDFDLYSEKRALETKQDDARVIKSGEIHTVQEKSLNHQGDEVYRSVSKIPIKDEHGKIVALLGLSRDISDIKRTEELCIRLGRILDDTLYELFIFEANTMKFIHVNQSGCRNTGYELEELVEMTPIELFLGYSPENFEELVRALLEETEDAIRFEASIARKNGTIYPADVRIQISNAENPPLFMAIIQDCTARKEAEEALRKAERSLLYAKSF